MPHNMDEKIKEQIEKKRNLLNQISKDIAKGDDSKSKAISMKKEKNLNAKSDSDKNNPLVKKDKISKIDPTSGKKKQISTRTKKIVSLLILGLLFGFFLFQWKPWLALKKQVVNLSLGSQSFITGSSSMEKEFKPFTEIYYKLSSNTPFKVSVLTIKIYKVGKDKKENLHKERQEIGIDPNAKDFSFVLRPDYFKVPGNYRVKMFFGRPEDKKIAAQYEFSIK